MADALALKRLTASDLTFFEPVFRRIGAGNQKSINLNADVLTARLYPGLGAIAERSPDGEIGLTLTIYGPSDGPAYRLRRKIVKGAAYKNWRLNGEFIHDPEGQPGRFDVLQPGDLAVLAFEGQPAPTDIALLLIAQGSARDQVLHSVLAPAVSARSMVELTPDAVDQAVAQAGLEDDHPLAAFGTASWISLTLEDAALGDSVAIRALRERRRGRPVTPEEFARGRHSAERTGAGGEALVDAYLRTVGPTAGIQHIWASQLNAISPYDFSTHYAEELESKVDVKSTRGAFGSDIHLSYAELIEAALASVPYRIYRVFNLTDEGADLRICADIRSFARGLLASHDRGMPPGVRADGFSVQIEASAWVWGEIIRIAPTGDGDEDED